MFIGFLRNASFYKIKAYSKVPIVQKVDCQDLNASEFSPLLQLRSSFPGTLVEELTNTRPLMSTLSDGFKEGVI